jgi:hypothetical protein
LAGATRGESNLEDQRPKQGTGDSIAVSEMRWILRNRQKGDWSKVTGGDAGAFYDGHHWVGFDCIGCMFASGILEPLRRVQLGDVATQVYDAMRNNKQYGHDRLLHNAWLAAGKPT